MHKQLSLLLLINSFFVFAINLFAPFYAIYVQKIDAAIYHVGGIWGLYLISVGILVLLVSRFENRVKYADYFLTLGFICRAIGWAGYIFATSVVHLYLIQIVLALGEAFGTPSYNLLYSKNLDKGRYGSEWGLHTSLNSFIIGIAAVVGGFVVQIFGFTVLFVSMIVLSLVSTVLAIRWRKLLGK